MFTKTQQEVLRFIFGANDSISERQTRISSGPQSMPIVKGSRQWKVAKDLERIGVAQIVTRNGFTYVQQCIQLTPEQTPVGDGSLMIVGGSMVQRMAKKLYFSKDQ